MTTRLSKSELRFREGKGERYLKTDPDKIRCQGVSKMKLRQARIEQMNPNLSPDDVWPEAQCEKSAEEGTYLCLFHGGRSPNITKKRIVDFMSVDLQEKFQIFEDNPDLLSRYVEMAQIQARNAQLHEQMEDLVLGQEAWEAVAEGLKWIDRGEIAKGVMLIRIALSDTRTEREVWDEIRRNWDLLLKFHTTQIATEEKLKTMATIDQVKSLVNGSFQSLQYILEGTLDDKRVINEILTEWAGSLKRLAGIRKNVELLDE